jgi:hypothetical protein
VNEEEQRPTEGAEGALARFESPPWGNEAAMSDDTAANQDELRDDTPPSDPDDERLQMGDPSEEGAEGEQQDSRFERGEQGG